MNGAMDKTLRLGLCLGLVAGATVGCSHESRSSQPPPAVPSSPGAVPTKAVTGRHLAVEPYLETDEERARLSEAESVLVSRCMKTHGFDYPTMVVGNPAAIPVLKGRYGPVDDEEAAAGYRFMVPLVDAQGNSVKFSKPLPPSTPALQAALSGSGQNGGCQGEAKQQLWAKVGAGQDAQRVAERIKSESFDRSQSDPRLLAAFDKWSQCMKSAGYSYKNPMDAVNDPKWTGPKPSASEVAVARKDVQCKGSAQLVDTWISVEDALENKDIEANSEQLAQGRRLIDDALRGAAKIVASPAG